MKTLKNYLIQNSEQTFSLLILTSVPSIHYLIPYKLVFLNLFFIIILLGAYYLDAHKGLMGGVLTILLVVIHVYYFPSSYMVAFTGPDLWMSILAWFSFLILTGAVVGKLTSRLKTEVEQLKERLSGLEAHLQEVEASATRLVSLDE